MNQANPHSTPRSKSKPHTHECGSSCHADHDHQEEWVKDFSPFLAKAKIGRNDLCPCGSEKKYKKCCLK